MKKQKLIIHILFILYIFLMLWLLYFQRLPNISFGNYSDKLNDSINLIPFRTICEYMATDANSAPHILKHAFINLAGNIVMFIPLGFFLPFIKPSCAGLKKIILITVVIIIVVELLQLFTLTGSFDVDDILLNTVGCVSGFGIHSIIFKNKH